LKRAEAATDQADTLAEIERAAAALGRGVGPAQQPHRRFSAMT
jgi:hypothetical protein